MIETKSLNISDLASLADTEIISPSEGDALVYIEDYWRNHRVSMLAFSQTANQTISDTTTETTIIGSGAGSLTLPAGFLIESRSIRLTVWGIYSTKGTPRMQIKSYCDASNIHDSGMQSLAKDVTNQAFEIRTVFTCRTVGSTGTLFAQGKALFFTTKNTSTEISLENAVVTVIDTTHACDLDIQLTWETADLDNIITSTNCFLELLN